jgi:uncharacterized protein (TIGR02265 family)
MIRMKTSAAPQKDAIVFSQLMEAFFKYAIPQRLDSETRGRLRKLGVDLDHPFQVAYPVHIWLESINICAEVLYPGLTREQSHYQIGRQLTTGYGQTMMGRAVFAMLRMMGWERSLTRIPRGLQSGTNFLTGKAQLLDSGQLEVVFEVMPDFHASLGGRPGIDPHLMNGCMDGMMEMVGAPFEKGALQPLQPGAQRVVYMLRRKA